jgi:laminin, alpha 3/5
MGGFHPVWALLLLVPQIYSETLTPPYFNLAEGRRITASSTCGVDIDAPELYCKLVGSHTDDQQNQTSSSVYEDTFNPGFLYPGKGHVVIQGQQCDYCTEHSHPVEYAIDGSEKWWQSPPLSRGMKYNEVNLTIDFEQVRKFYLEITLIFSSQFKPYQLKCSLTT